MESNNLTSVVLKHPYLEVPFLTIVMVLGTLGNVLIILAVKVDKKLRVTGIWYIVNLAVADLFITAWYFPIILANIFAGYQNILDSFPYICSFNGFGSALCCQVSMLSLTAIAFNRYVKVLHPKIHTKYFKKNWQVAIFLSLLWLQGFMISLPIAIGWFGKPPLVGFDVMMMSCMWNDIDSDGYNIFLVMVAIFIPLIITAFCYYKLFIYMQEQGKKKIKEEMARTKPTTCNSMQQESKFVSTTKTKFANLTVMPDVRTHFSRQNSLDRHAFRKQQKMEERECQLMKSVLVVLIGFVLFWTPYALMTLINTSSNPLAKRVCGWLALSNSAINSFIYGVMNQHFRQAYVKLFRQMCCCVCKSIPNRIFPNYRSNKEITTQLYTTYSVTFHPTL